MKGWYGVDLDGTLAHYEGWKNEEHIGEPIPAMVDLVRQWLAEGWEVRIFTARVQAGRDVERITNIIQDWTEKHLGARLPVTNQKDYAMVCLYDDRCVQVESNTGRLIGGEYHGIQYR